MRTITLTLPIRSGVSGSSSIRSLVDYALAGLAADGAWRRGFPVLFTLAVARRFLDCHSTLLLHARVRFTQDIDVRG